MNMLAVVSKFAVNTKIVAITHPPDCFTVTWHLLLSIEYLIEQSWRWVMPAVL